MLKNTAVRRALYAGMGLQIFQQFVGINTVMYYSPTIIQLAGITSNQTALLLSLITSGLNAFGSILSIYSIDRIGRKKLVLISLVGCTLSLCIIFAPFYVTETHSPAINPIATSHFNGTCPGFDIAMKTTSTPWDCNNCLQASPACGFCSNPSDKVKNHCHPPLSFSLYPHSNLLTREMANCSCVAALPRGVFGLERRLEESMSSREKFLVYRGMSFESRLASDLRAFAVYHLVLAGNGDSSMGCELRDISVEVQRSVWRNGSYFGLGFEFDCLSNILGDDKEHWNCMDFHDLRFCFFYWNILRPHLRTRN